jgi:hypothetical protein
MVKFGIGNGSQTGTGMDRLERNGKVTILDLSGFVRL